MADKSFSLDQIADLYELEPWQRELLEALARHDELAKTEKDSYRAKVRAEYERIVQWLETEYPTLSLAFDDTSLLK